MVDEELRTRIKSVVDNLSFRIGDYRDERKNNPDRYGLGVVAAGGVTEEQHTTRLLDGLFVIFKTRKVTKVLVEMKDGENTERMFQGS